MEQSKRRAVEALFCAVTTKSNCIVGVVQSFATVWVTQLFFPFDPTFIRSLSDPDELPIVMWQESFGAKFVRIQRGLTPIEQGTLEDSEHTPVVTT